MNDKIKGSLYGLLVGDALGVPYEFRDAAYLARLPGIDMLPPINHVRTYKDAKAGTWSDEGAMALCMMNTLNDCHTFKPEFYMRQLVSYQTQGLYTVNHHVFGCTRHFEQVIKNYLDGGKLFQLDEKMDSRDSSTLARMLPLAIFDAQNDASSTIKLAHTQSLLTHAHPLNGIGAAIYGQWVKNLINGVKNPFVKGVAMLLHLYNEDCRQLIIEDIIKQNHSTGPNDVAAVLMNSYQVISRTTSFHGALREAVLLGGQTSATGAVVGGIAGLMYGYQEIPAAWMEMLRGREVADQVIERFAVEIGDHL